MNVNKNNEAAAEQFIKEQEEKTGIDKPIINFKAPTNRKTEAYQELGNQIGYQVINIEDLPTRGLCYPEGTTIAIRPAKTAEIRHWSTINEDDILAVDDMLNYIMERCVQIRFPNENATYKNLAEIDRLYLIFAIREYTFINTGNKLKINISDTKTLDVTKDMVDYVRVDDLMQYYDPEKRSFVLKVKGGRQFEIVFPTLGVVSWIKDYIKRCNTYKQEYDEVFIDYAVFLIKDYKDLSKKDYYKSLVEDSLTWTHAEISVLNYVRNLFKDAVDVQVKYIDEDGSEKTAPLSFRGGIKSLFIISDVSDIHGLLE